MVVLEHFRWILDLGEALERATVAAWNLNRQNELVIMTLSKDDEVLMRDLSRVTWRVSPPPLSYGATLWRIGPQGVLQTLDVAGISVAFPSIQSLSSGRFLLAGGRCRPYSGGDLDENCVVIGADGGLVGRFCVGDAVEDVQVGAGDSIWVSYFDEGAMSNRAWSRMVESSGLIRYALSGEREWHFSYGMTDCYSLNVTRDATWLCPYSEFPIFRVKSDGQVTRWSNEFRRGCRALCFWGDHLLLVGGYAEEHSLATLVRLEGDKAMKVADFDLGLPADVPRCLTGRGHFLHYVTDQGWWTLDMRDLM